MRILILCTGNSCRSQMAEGFLRAFNPNLEVYSAGTHPASSVSAKAVRVMNEAGIDIRGHHPKNVDRFVGEAFDYVITVCDHAKESCPVFTGAVKHRLHIGFEDPAEALGTEEFVLGEFRRIRDQIGREFQALAERIAR